MNTRATLSLVVLLSVLLSCSENQRAKSWGGDMTVDLPCGEMLFEITWKDDDLWYATQPMPEDHEPVTTTFHRKADGMHLVGGGTVTVNECR